MIKTRDANTKLYLFFKKRHKNTHTHPHLLTHIEQKKNKKKYI